MIPQGKGAFMLLPLSAARVVGVTVASAVCLLRASVVTPQKSG